MGIPASLLVQRMKNQAVFLVLALVLGVGIGWIIKPDRSTSSPEGFDSKGLSRVEARPRPVMSDDGDGKEPPVRRSGTRTMALGGDNEPSPEEKAMQEQISKAMEDRQSKSDEKQIASLIEKLGLDAAQEAALREYFAKRRGELAKLFSEESNEAPDMSRFSESKLDDLMAEILSGDQMETFDVVKTAEREKKVESRALKDLAKLNSVVDLRPEQKDAVYQVLYDDAGIKVDKAAESGSSIFGTMFGGGFGVEMDMDSIAMHDSAYVTGAGIEGEGAEAGMAAFRDAQQKRIEDQVNRLSSVLDENQLKNYRDHLESQGSMFESFASPPIGE